MKRASVSNPEKNMRRVLGRQTDSFHPRRIRFRTMLIILFAAGIFLCSGCDRNSPPVPKEKFVLYYIDLIALQDSLGRDKQSTEKITAQLNRKYNISGEEYTASLSYFSRSPEAWQSFFESVSKELSRRQTKPIR